MSSKGPDEPWTQEQIYQRTQQNLYTLEQTTLGTESGKELIEWQKYIASQPSYAEGGMTPAALQRMQDEAFGEMATLAQRAVADPGQRQATAEQTKKLRSRPGIGGRTSSSGFDHMSGSQEGKTAAIREDIVILKNQGRSGKGPRPQLPNVPGFKTAGGARNPETGRRGPGTISPDTGNQELDALVAQSARLAGVGVTYTGGTGEGKEARLNKVTQAAQAREQRASGTDTATRRRGRAKRQQDNNFDNSQGLGTSDSIGAGTLLGS